MENTIILQGTTPEAIAKTVCDMFESRFEDLKKNLLNQTENDDLLTREQVLELLQINASTLWHWQNKGRITVHKFANKCYYKRSEIMASLITLKK
ncbi:AlpA family transcriptional regulator [Flavobacterium sp. GP15]|uniref:helix-turn-helix transcriptional regulator n=1 Tax=Flavobacterium sp. GP15 TaxID=2758567 RepID=UPI00165D3E48|nr:helix-turn-helix domain-containing protein [Flavobacterium sp. GP15]